jgi:hypothetical protein
MNKSDLINEVAKILDSRKQAQEAEAIDVPFQR